MVASTFAQTPDPPYYAVIFTSHRAEGDPGYSHAADRMTELAAQQAGFLGVESVRGNDGMGITVSYWESLEAIKAWKLQEEHREAQSAGRSVWYSHYHVRISQVLRDYSKEMAV